jgi:hypothetical protein
MPITDYIEATETILTQTAARLAGYPGWQVRLFPGTSLPALYQELTTAQLPAAIVTYQGARRDRLARRLMTLQVLVAAPASQATDGPAQARLLLDQCLALLDEFAYGDATWSYQSDLPLDLGTELALYLVEFHVHLR